MSWPAMYTAVAGTVLTASTWNAEVKNRLTLLKTSIDDDGLLLPAREMSWPLGGSLADFIEDAANTWVDLPNGALITLPATLPTGLGLFLDMTGLQDAAGTVTLETRLYDVTANAAVSMSDATKANPGTSPVRAVGASSFAVTAGHVYRGQMRRTTTNARVAALVRVFVGEV